MPSQTSTKWRPQALALQASIFAKTQWGGPHDEPSAQDEWWSALVYKVVYATALINPMESAEGVEELAKENLHAVLTNPGEDGNTDVDGGSVYRMLTCRETMSYINHGTADCNQQCCISIYDTLERR